MANPLYGQNKADDNLDQLGTAYSGSATWDAGSIADGNEEAQAAAPVDAVDRDHGDRVLPWPPLLSEAERTVEPGGLRCLRGGIVSEVLRREAGPSKHPSGGLLPHVADWLL